MNLKSTIESLCNKIRKSDQAKQILTMYSPFSLFSLIFNRLEDNWFDDIEYLRSLSESEWIGMKLPIRLLKMLMSEDESTQGVMISENRSLKDAEPEKPSVSRLMSNLSLNHQENENKAIEEEKICHTKQIEIIKDEVDNTFETKNIELKDCFVDLDDFEDILHQLNMKGEKHGVTFKRGTIQYWEDKSVKYKSIICSCVSRNHGANKRHKKQENKRSLETSTENKKGECEASYRFKYEKGSGLFLGLISSYEIHSYHELKVKKSDLTKEMIQEINFFNKKSGVL